MRTTPDGMKVCSKCQLNREVTWFYKDKKYVDGLRVQCKECRSAYEKARHRSLRYTRPSLTTGTKICSKCKEEKDISLFPRDPRNKDGRRSNCRACEVERSRRYYYSDLELSREKQREANRKNYWESDGKLMAALRAQDRRKEQKGYL
jgi:hypothetical protein